jgi:hypothetical protein
VRALETVGIAAVQAGDQGEQCNRGWQYPAAKEVHCPEAIKLAQQTGKRERGQAEHNRGPEKPVGNAGTHGHLRLAGQPESRGQKYKGEIRRAPEAGYGWAFIPMTILGNLISARGRWAGTRRLQSAKAARCREYLLRSNPP